MRAGHKAAIARASGRVQGVSFRIWTRAEATKLGLTGWVRNESDGSVTALIVGSETAVSALAKKLWAGPASASVSNVTFEVIDLKEEPTSFRITTTG
jgi:acylphosphatase